MLLNKDIAYLIKIRIRDSLTVCRFNQVCRAANLHEIKWLPDGKTHGFMRHYSNNNILEFEVVYRNGKPQDLWTWYYNDDINTIGQLQCEMTYKDGYPHGLWKWYYINGQLKSEGTFRDGKKHGLWKWYYENEQLHHEGTYYDC